MAANRESIFMVEGGGKEVSENDMIEALLFGQRAIEPLLKAQEQLAEAVRAEKRSFEKIPMAEGVASRVRDAVLERVRAAYGQNDKHERYGQLAQIKKDVVEQLCAEGQPFAGKEKDVKTALEDLKYEHMRRMITHEGKRIGGRDTRTVRKIESEVGVLPRAHGSALFTAARRRPSSPPRWAPPTTSSGWRASRGSPSASSCCTTTSRPTRSGR